MSHALITVVVLTCTQVAPDNIKYRTLFGGEDNSGSKSADNSARHITTADLVTELITDPDAAATAANEVALDEIKKTDEAERKLDREKCRAAIKTATDPLIRRKAVPSMLSIERKANIVHLMTEIVLRPELKGDWVETGTWMGGASLIAAYIQKVALEEPSCGPDVPQRKIWLADSFKGLPPEADDETKEAGYTKTMDKAGSYAFEGGLDTVKNLFLKHGFEIDGSGNVPIYFIKGYFNDTLHDSPIEDIAVLRLDGDMYASTLQALFALYRRVRMDGYIIVSIL